MKKLFILFLYLLIAIPIMSQDNSADLRRNAIIDLLAQVSVYPQEKIYLQTDRPYYVSGEKIFFRAFLLRSFDHKPADFSRYVYVELVSSADTVTLRQQIRITDDKMFYGALSLPDNLPQGNYRIRAYSRFMENLGESSFYTRSVFIADPNVSQTEVETDLKFLGDKQTRANLPEINFYPEGGNLVAGQANRVAFKALLPSRQAAEITGSVFNSKNELQTTFTTQHEGMGDFMFEPQAGESYYAQYKMQEQTGKVNLPEVKNNSYSLQTQWKKDSLSVKVLKPKTMPEQTCYLLIHCRGVPIYLDKWDFAQNEKKWHQSDFQSGVIRILLLTEELRPISERAVFNNLHDNIEVKTHTAKNSYKSRELVSLDIQLLNTSDSIPASFALSITDDKDVKIDTTTHIMAEILLVSELAGRVNNPAQYFKNDKNTVQQADLLMLNNGWRRYHVEEALQGNIQKPQINPEKFQSLSGVLKGKTGRPYQAGKIQMSVMGHNLSEATLTDDNGRYLFNNFEFPDSTAYFFLSYTNKKTENVEIFPDVIAYPTITPLQHYLCNITAIYTDFSNFVSKADMKYIQENGIRMRYLPELEIKAVHKKNHKRYDNGAIQGIMPDRWISSEELTKEPSLTFEDLFYRFPGVTEVSEQEGVRIRGGNAMILVNGRRIDYSDLLTFYNPIEIAQVDMYAEIGITKIWNTDYPVFALTVWQSGEGPYNAMKLENEKVILPLGYQNPVEFYSPKYDTPETLNNPSPDLRSTIYWKPDIITNNNNASVEFYIADSSTTYSVIIEGISNDGKLIYSRKDSIINVVKR